MPGTTALRTTLFTFFAVFLFSLWLAWQPTMGLAVDLFMVMAVLVQSVLLSSPVLLMYALQRTLARRGISTTWLTGLMLLAAVLVLVFMFANYKLRDMYGFYVNYFVVNLLTTPGGVEAMGVPPSTNRTLVIGVIALAGAVWAALRYIPFERLYPGWLKPSHLWSSLILVLLIQSGWYAYAEFRYDRAVLGVSDRIIWYIPVTARGFLENMGVEIIRPDGEEFDIAQGSGKLDYPPTPQLEITKPYNIVWLVAESWRADMLTPEIMPNVWKFAQNHQQFRQHYSGGNGTRMGMFSQFYGLYGNYWFDFLYANRSPLMMDIIHQNDYAMMAYTSSRFSYPEFDKTVFAGLDANQLQSLTEGQGWERDR
ncbi:MAG: hypothetical protein RQ757_14035, partial [Pseudomonadales bacterium]|nr:hypothetical protein [Pseudomonadales bacterium]